MTVTVTGVTEIDTKLFATLSVAGVLVILSRLAVIFVLPISVDLASPVLSIVAILLLLLNHVTLEVILTVESFLYVPVAVNCSTFPFIRLTFAGKTEIDINFESTIFCK